MCGYDSQASVSASWKFFVPLEPPSQNSIARNAGSFAHRRRYADWRDQFTLLIRSKMKQVGIPDAGGRRRLVLTRFFTGRSRAFDRGNLVGGCKLVLDAAVAAGLLVDDDERHLEDHYKQRKHDALSGLEIEVHELAPR
jgi:Holliday junction resolvase RusA-like endonuclease